MPVHTTPRRKKKSKKAQKRKQAQAEQAAKAETTPERRLGGRMVGLSLALMVLMALQSSVLMGTIPLVGMATLVSGLFMLSIVASGVQIWRGLAPEGRLESLLSGIAVVWPVLLGGLLIASAGLAPEWQSGYASDYATSTIPFFMGGGLALLLGGWVSQTIHGTSRLRRAVLLYSGLATATAVMMFGMFPAGLTAETVQTWGWLQRLSGLLPFTEIASTAPWVALALLASIGAHLLVFWGAWRLRADAEVLNQRSLEDLW